MTRDRADTRTLNLLEWEPPHIEVARFEERVVRAASLRARIARAVSQALKDDGRSRDDIAFVMSDWLGEDVTKNMLDAYASEAREDHTIPYLRLLALIEVTGDVRLLQLGAEMFGHLVVDNKYLDWVEIGMEADRKDQVDRLAEEIDRSYAAKLRQIRRGRP